MTIETLRQKGNSTNIAIERDIKGSYNNVNRTKLIDLISLRIKDKQFLKIIQSPLDTGIIERQRYIHTLTGTPQKEIVSPLLFNIYMFPLDKFIFADITKRTKNNTKKPNRTSSEYNKIAINLRNSRVTASKFEKTRMKERRF